jgi:hypothetical protein
LDIAGVIILHSAVVIDASDVEGAKTQLENDKRISPDMISPDNPENVAEKK